MNWVGGGEGYVVRSFHREIFQGGRKFSMKGELDFPKLFEKRSETK